MNFLYKFLSLLLDIIPWLPVFLILYLLYRISLPNPFQRFLFRRKYSIRPVSSLRRNHTVRISFIGNEIGSHFREALYACMYTYPDTKNLEFENLSHLSIEPQLFEHFRFDTISFAHIPATDYNCFAPFNLPCSHIIFPPELQSIPLLYSHHGIKGISIPSPVFVPAKEYITYDPSGEAIPVHSDFTIRVPRDLIPTYSRNPVWNSIILIDENGHTFSPSFIPYFDD